MIRDDPAGEAGIAAPPYDRRRGPGAPNDDVGEQLERERRRARQASADARHAEREALELRSRLSLTIAELKVERRRCRALRQRRSMRLAVAVSDRLRGLVRAATRRRRAQSGTEPVSAAATPEDQVARAEADPRSRPRLYRKDLLSALLDPRGRAHPLRVTLVGDAAAGLRTALTARGYEVRIANGRPSSESWPGGGDVTVVLDPRVDAIALPAGVVRVAWTADAGSAWPANVVAEYDIVVLRHKTPAGPS